MEFETAAIHIPRVRRDGAIAPPIHLSTTFEHGPANERINAHEYIRDGNPNVDDLQARLAHLEGAAGCVVFASGMAAGAAMLQTLPAGSRVLFHKDLYFDFASLARTLLPRWGLEIIREDLTDETVFNAAIEKRPSLVWFETPSNPRLNVIDIKRAALVAHSVGAKVLVDSTFAPPLIQKPLEHGADFVLHSLTKYMGGHSDIQGGSVSFFEDRGVGDELLYVRRVTGAALSPFNAWMISRGVQTLSCRLTRHCENAAAVARTLSAHPKVSRVRYPFLETDSGYNIATRQMTAGGGMVSFEAKGGRDAALSVASRVKLFVNATSLGGVESLIEHRASVEGPGTTTPDSLLRLSIGLESASDLIEDLRQALE